MRGRHRHQHSAVTDRERADAVHSRNGDDVKLLGHLRRHIAQAVDRARVVGVAEVIDGLAVVVVANHPVEEVQPTCTRILDRCQHLGHIERLVAYGDQPHARIGEGVGHGPQRTPPPPLAGTGNFEVMNDQPRGIGDGDDNNEPDNQNNPFKGTPFEQLFGSMGAGGGDNPFAQMFGGAQGGQMPFDLGAMMQQIQSMMAPYDGPVNWASAIDSARKIAAQEPDPTPDRSQHTAVADAFRLADHWLDTTTSMSSGVTTTAAWSRADWIEQTKDVWQVLVTPVAESVINAMGNAMPEEAKSMAGPLIGMLAKAGGSMFGLQLGQALGGLAGEVLTASDIGLPLGPEGTAALVSSNVKEFADGLDVDHHDVVLYLALREAAHQRLFSGVPWLRQHLISSVERFGAGVNIDMSGIEEAMQNIDPSNPAAVQEAMQAGLFEPKRSPEQEAALLRLETTLALVEGWVDEVVSQATAERMPAAARIQEAMRRRRAAGGPAEETFAALVGLELRPRRLRDASTLWGSLRSRQGEDGRDAVWAHPDLLPTASDLDDPLGFRENLDAESSISDEDFDTELGKLLDGE